MVASITVPLLDSARDAQEIAAWALDAGSEKRWLTGA